MLSFSTLFSLSLAITSLVGSATAVHREGSRRAHDRRGLHKRFSGQATYYKTGLGACGGYNSPGDYIVALNTAQYGSGYPGPQCGKKLRISYKGKSAVATVVDECPTCGFGALDLSQGLFEHFENTDAGIFQMTWEWTSGGGGGGGGNNGGDDDKDEEEEKAKKSRASVASKSNESIWSTKAAASRASVESEASIEEKSSRSNKSLRSLESVASVSSASVAGALTTSVAAEATPAPTATPTASETAAIATKTGSTEDEGASGNSVKTTNNSSNNGDGNLGNMTELLVQFTHLISSGKGSK